MNPGKKNNGFTLLEILIVLVILGVIAGLAIPAYQASVEKSRSQEALTSIAAIRDSMIRYFALNNTYAGACFNGGTSVPICGAGSPNALDYDPATNTGGQRLHFTYGLTKQGNGVGNAATFEVTATRNAIDGGDGSSTIVMKQDGTIVKTGVYGA